MKEVHMAVQNLVSVTITPEMKEAIRQALADLKVKCRFSIVLTPEEIKGLVKAGEGYSIFLNKAYNAAITYPGIMPPVFNKDEFTKDYLFAQDLEEIVNECESFMETLRNTLIAACSDTMIEALEVYAAVQQNKDKVPGLNIVYEEMAKHFKRPRTKKEEAGNQK
jgi:hypothetical protein